MKTRLLMALAAVAVTIPLAASAGPDDKTGRREGPDTNKDGYLSRAEAQAAADARFARLDANSDGKLTPGERPDRPRRDGRGGPGGDGAPGPGAGRMGPPDGGPGGAGAPGGPRMGMGMGMGMGRGMGMAGPGLMGPVVFEEYDANKDGALSKVEFRKHALKVFDAQDGNGDNKIKLPDRQRMQGERGHHGGHDRGPRG
jgi:hypothetical protein